MKTTVTPTTDPFYSPENINELKRRIAEMNKPAHTQPENLQHRPSAHSIGQQILKSAGGESEIFLKKNF